jgi:hypothetical protein
MTTTGSIKGPLYVENSTIGKELAIAKEIIDRLWDNTNLFVYGPSQNEGFTYCCPDDPDVIAELEKAKVIIDRHWGHGSLVFYGPDLERGFHYSYIEPDPDRNRFNLAVRNLEEMKAKGNVAHYDAAFIDHLEVGVWSGKA